MLLLAAPSLVTAQDGETPLGDVARKFRKKPASSEVVVDNDNLSKVVDDAASRRVAGSSLVFSLDPGANRFRVSSPDVTCSLSFSAKTSSLLSDPAMLDELPRTELAKLDGPATIDGDSLQVSMHNGTDMGTARSRHRSDHRETARARGSDASNFGQARIVPAVAGESPPQVRLIAEAA